MASALPLTGHLGPMQRRFGAIVLGSEVPVIAFAALGIRGLAVADGDPRAGLLLWVGLGLALAAGVVAGMLRRPFGVTLGWLVQLALLASSLLASQIAIVACVFIGLWAVCLIQGRRMDMLTEEYRRTHPQGAA